MSVRACIFGCAGTRLTESERAFFHEANPFAFILFSRNLGSHDDIRRLTDGLRSAVGRNVPVLIDQEGGRVQRARGDGWREWLPALEQCERLRPAQSVRAMWLRYRLISAELRSVGIDGNCVPVADIATDCTHPVILNRCYGRDAEQVSANARSAADACLDSGVLPVLKHIPGQGRPNSDSHLELPYTDAEKTTLAETDFVPFKLLHDLPLGMTTHVVFRSIDDANPATQSKKVIDVVRGEIGFNGLLMTDDISMSALAGSVRERCRKSLEAGCDVVLHCNGDLAEMTELAGEAGQLVGQGARRAARALAARHAVNAIDTRPLDDEFEGIMEKWLN